MPVKQPELLLHLARLGQSVAIEPDRLGVGHPVAKAQPEEPRKRMPVADLIRDLVIRQVAERAQNQRLEPRNRVRRLAPGAGCPLSIRLAPDLLQQRPDLLPRHNGPDLGRGSLFASRLA